MAYDLILFDCDGTLVDSEYLNIKAIITLITEYGVDGYDVTHGLNHFSGHRFSRILDMITKETAFQFPKDAGQRYLEKVRALAKTDMKIIAGVQGMVIAAQENASIYVVSNGERKNVLLSLEFAGLTPYFSDERVISGAMSPNPKPAPDLFLMASTHANISPEKSLVIEDSIAGVHGAVAAGMEAWGFCGAHHDHKGQTLKLLDAGASKVFSTMEEMRTCLISAYIK